MRVFVNNVDGFLGGAICADLWKLSHTIMGTRKNRMDSLVPPFIKRIVVRTDVRKLLKCVASCDLVVYDLHDADMEELELVLRVLHSSEITHQMTFIIISSVGVWGRTQRSYEDFEAVDGAEAPPAEAPAADADGEAPAEGADGEATVKGLEATTAPPGRRPNPLKSEDYIRRIPAPKFKEWKSIETTALALRDKGTVRPYIVCAGIPYGNGEEAFLGMFKAAWQSRDSLRYIGDGLNFIPCVHARDCARLVRRIVETKPDLEYHLAVDRGDVTQKEIAQAVATEFRTGFDVSSVSVPEALLAELADILTLDLRLEPSPIMEPTKEEEPPAEGEEPPAEGAAEDVDEAALAATIKPPVNFRWWSEKGIVANITEITAEFLRWRRLKPVHLLVLGPPGSGASKLVEMLCDWYAIESANMDDLMETLRNSESPLGGSVKDMLGQIESALGNPKSTGPFSMPVALTQQILDETVFSKASSTFRGYVLSGFPSAIDEGVEFFLEDGPVPEVPPPAEGAEPEAPLPAPKIFKASVAPDAVIFLNSSDEACLQRVTDREKPMPEAEFQKKLSKWKECFPEEGPGLSDVFSERGVKPLMLDVDDVEPEALLAQIVAHFESTCPVYNFRVPASKRPGSEVEATEPVEKPDEGALAKEAEGKRKKKEEEDKLEAIKKEEFIRLEKHSEPLRQYLMQFVVPTLTTGLIDVCRETPEDPIAYLAEYLSTYSTQLVAARRKKRLAAAQGSPPASAS